MKTKLKILVFDPDVSLRKLLKIYLEGLGHEVLTYTDPSFCPIYRNIENDQCCCPQDRPCGDVVIVDIKMPSFTAIDFLELQRRRGCKALDANKAVMSTSVTKTLESAMANFGCHHILKPFRLVEIRAWIEGCAERIGIQPARSNSEA